MFRQNQIDTAILNYILNNQENEFILWMKDNPDKLSKLNHLFTGFTVNLLNFLLTHHAMNAFNYAISCNIADIPGYIGGEKTTVLFEKAKNLIGLKDEDKKAIEDNIAISKKLMAVSNVNYIMRSSKATLKKLQAVNHTSYHGPKGKTVLMYYAFCGCKKMVKKALQNGASATINVRDFGPAYLTEAESRVTHQIPQNDNNYRFDTALSMAFTSTETNDGEIIKLLLDHGADLSIFYDSEFYRPTLFTAVADFDDNIAQVSPECRTKVEIILRKIEEKNLHLTACKETYRIFTEMLSEHGYRYKQRMCTLM